MKAVYFFQDSATALMFWKTKETTGLYKP